MLHRGDEAGDRRRVKETEADGPLSGADHVVQTVRLDDTAQIAAARNDPVSDAAVDEDIVEEEIDEAVGDDTQPEPGPGGAEVELGTHEYGETAGEAEQQGEAIVALERAGAFGVVAGVPEPHGPVHDPAVSGIGEPFHQRHGGEEEGEAGGGADVHLVWLHPGRRARQRGDWTREGHEVHVRRAFRVFSADRARVDRSIANA